MSLAGLPGSFMGRSAGLWQAVADFNSGQRGIYIMKKLIIALFGALAMLSLTSTARAEDGLKYDDVARCAAFNLLSSQIFSEGSEADKEKNKDRAEKYKNQAVALIILGAAISKQDTEKVIEDVKARNQAMYALLGDEQAAGKLIQDNAKYCNSLGEAAVEALAEVNKK